MSKTKKILCMLLVFTLIIAPCSLFNTALAQTADSEPLKIEVSTDKSSYTAYGIAEITVKVTNTSDETVNNISAEAVFEQLAPVSKKTNETFKEVESLQSGESFSFSYKATINANKVKLNFFEKIILWFVRLFNGGYNATENNFDNSRELIENHHTINFGNHTADNNVKVWYDLVTFSLFDTDKFTIDVGKETDVKFQIKINSTQSIKNNEVELFCENEVVGILNDNGKNSDNIAGDNIFSGIITVSENERMSKYYYVECNGIKSDTKELDFYKQATDDEEIIMKSFREATDEIKAKYRSDIVDAIDENSAKKAAENLYNELADYLDNNPYITEYQFVEFGIMVAFDFGLNSGISLNDVNYGEDISSNSRGVAGTKSQLNAINNEELKIMTLEPSADELNTTVIDDAARKIESSKSNYVFTDNLDNQAVTVETMKSLDKYRIIILNGHGGNWDGDGYVVPLSEKPNETKNNYYKSTRDLDKTILDYGAYYVITEAFFDKYYSQDDLKNCLIYLGTCHGGDDNVKIRDILDRKGSQAVITYKNSVTDRYSDEMVETIFEYLSDDYTITESVEKAKRKNGAKDPYISKDTYDKLTFWQQMGWNLGLLKLENPAEIVLSGNNLQFQLSTKIIEDCNAIVSGVVKDKETDKAIPGVNVEIVDNESDSLESITTVTTNENGVFSVELPYGSYSFTFHHDNYEYYSIAQTVDVDYVSFGEISLIPKNSSSGGNDSTGGEDEERTVTDSGSCGDNLTWTLYDDGELVIRGTGDMPNWTSLSSVPWYSHNSNITKAVINKGVTNIDSKAFYGYDKLETVVIPDSVTNIDENAFSDCDALKNIAIPSSITSIGRGTFSGCNSLEGIIIPNSVKSIDDSAFYNCISLKNIAIPNSVTSIGIRVFQYCFSLKTVTIGNSVTSIGSQAFEGCSSLENITIGNSVECISAKMFNDCTSLRKIIIPGCVKEISNAFGGCTSLSDITILDGVEIIDSYAFLHCTALENIRIPSSVTSVSNKAFLHCTSLKSIIVDNYNLNYSSDVYGVLYNKNKTVLIKYPEGNELTDYEIIDGVTYIMEDAFYNCCYLKKIKIPKSITTISPFFEQCYALESINVNENNKYYFSDECGVLYNKEKTRLIRYPAGNPRTSYSIIDCITAIGDYAFEGCSNLKTVTIPENVTLIGNNAFENCNNLMNVTIPKSVTKIYTWAFKYCDSLTDVYYRGSEDEWCQIYGYSELENATIHYNS